MHRSRPENLRETFDWVCDRFPPVLRHFFTENFRSPRAWAAARLSYARSTAAASMAGYVIGLGDRHSHNILLDLRSAEAVHIDLGIAFEQGSFLATPELVPFRLTRDIVDGLGPAGVDGVLARRVRGGDERHAGPGRPRGARLRRGGLWCTTRCTSGGSPRRRRETAAQGEESKATTEVTTRTRSS